MKNKFAYINIILLIMAFASPSNVKAEEVVRVGIFDFPPFYSKKFKEDAKGILVDFAKNHIQKIGAKAEFKILNTPALIKSLVDGYVDVGMLIKHPALIDNTYYSKKPISEINLVSYRGGNTLPISSYEDLAGKKVLVLAGYGYGGLLKRLDALESRPDLIQVSDIHSGIDMLMAGRGDYYLSYLKPSEAIAKRKGYLSEKSWLVSDSISKLDVYWVVSKKIEDGQNLLNRLEAVE